MSFPLTLDKFNFTKCAAEIMVYVERHKLLEIITQILAEISIVRPNKPRDWIAENIIRIADSIYKNCIRINNNKNVACNFYQLPRRFHHRVVIYGCRGSGRRSQALSLAKQFNLVFLDAHSLIEHNLKGKDKSAQQLQDAFELPNNDIQARSTALCKIISERFLQSDCLQKGWVIINFPNNIFECKELFENFTVPPNKVVVLECPEDMAFQRLMKKPDLGCPQDLTSHIEMDMHCFKQNEPEIRDYLRSRYEIVCVDGKPCFESVRVALLCKLETTPYLMGFKLL